MNESVCQISDITYSVTWQHILLSFRHVRITKMLNSLILSDITSMLFFKRLPLHEGKFDRLFNVLTQGLRGSRGKHLLSLQHFLVGMLQISAIKTDLKLPIKVGDVLSED